MPVTNKFQNNVDSWIKEFGNKLNSLEEKNKQLSFNESNIQHNYELITELKLITESLEHYINMMMDIIIVNFKNKIKEETILKKISYPLINIIIGLSIGILFSMLFLR